MKKFFQFSEQNIKLFVIGMELLAVVIFIYVVSLPFYPILKYHFNTPSVSLSATTATSVIEAIIKKNQLSNKEEYRKYPNRIFIPKIGVNAPIIISHNEKYGLSKGAWLYPQTSTPDKGGNTVITAHRFKYLPPNNLTFYLIDKLIPGDIITVLWQEKYYHYKVRETRIVDKHDTSVLNPSQKPILTIFSCHPIYSTKNRYVVISDLLNTTD